MQDYSKLIPLTPDELRGLVIAKELVADSQDALAAVRSILKRGVMPPEDFVAAFSGKPMSVNNRELAEAWYAGHTYGWEDAEARAAWKEAGKTYPIPQTSICPYPLTVGD